MIRNYQRGSSSSNADLAPIYNSINALQMQVNDLYTRTGGNVTVPDVPDNDILYNVTVPGTYSQPISYEASFLTAPMVISNIDCPSITIDQHSVHFSISMEGMSAKYISHRGDVKFSSCSFGKMEWLDGDMLGIVSSCTINDLHITGTKQNTNGGNALQFSLNSISSMDVFYPNGYIDLASNRISYGDFSVNQFIDHGEFRAKNINITAANIELLSNMSAEKINVFCTSRFLCHNNSLPCMNVSLFQTAQASRNTCPFSVSGCSFDYANFVGIMDGINIDSGEVRLAKCTFSTLSMNFDTVYFESNVVSDIADMRLWKVTLMSNTCTGVFAGSFCNLYMSYNSLTVGQMYYINSFGYNNNISMAQHF